MKMPPKNMGRGGRTGRKFFFAPTTKLKGWARVFPTEIHRVTEGRKGRKGRKPLGGKLETLPRGTTRLLSVTQFCQTR